MPSHPLHSSNVTGIKWNKFWISSKHIFFKWQKWRKNIVYLWPAFDDSVFWKNYGKNPKKKRPSTMWVTTYQYL